ncbi:MarR family transcriptional regulator [Mycolicibacterium litorale]|nr:MarR family transcriptional regulator [Mycolicibacterium litorale]
MSADTVTQPTPTSAPATELREAMMALARQLRRHRPDNGLTLSQLELLGDVSRAGVTTPAEIAGRLQVRVQSLTDSINELEARGLLSRRPDAADRRRQLVELTPAGLDLLLRDRAQRDAWLSEMMRDHLSELEFNLLMLTAPVLRKLADAEHRAQSVP